MLIMPEHASTIASIIGIDPGTDTLGVANIYFDIPTMRIVSTQAQTLKGAKCAAGSWTSEINGDRWGRIESHYETLGHIFNHYQPLEIACEAPFINRRQPQAGLALTEVVAMIKHAVIRYDSWKRLYMIDPPTVKNAVGVLGRAGGPEGKMLMRTAVLAMPVLNYNGEIPLEQLDEHSIDAIAVAYCRFKNLLDELCLTQTL